MEANLLRLNDSKREFMVLASRHIETKLSEDVRSIRLEKQRCKQQVQLVTLV